MKRKFRKGNPIVKVREARKATIKEVAAKARVSIATVSRVVNGGYYVSPRSAARVTRAIAELEYQPNIYARGLKGAPSLTIALVVSDISNTFFNQVAKAIEDVVFQRNYNLIVCSTEGLPDRELGSLRALLYQKVNGLVINTTGHNDEFIAKISRLVPITLLVRALNAQDFRGDRVDSANRLGATLLTNHLIALGHKRIGSLNGPMDLSSGIERFQGYKASMLSAGQRIEIRSPQVFVGDFTEEAGYEGMEYFRSKQPKTTGVVVMNNSMTLGALRLLREHGTAVPGDLSIVCYGDLVDREVMYVRPTIVTLDARTIGKQAARMLLTRIKNPSIENREFVYKPTLLFGDSSGPPRR